jgi:hypothetical protein
MKTYALASTIVVTTVLTAGIAGSAVAADSASTKHLTVATSTASGPVAPGTRVSLVIEIAPKPAMHVYAPGQKDFIPISLTLAASDAFKAEAVQFPAAEKLSVKELGETHLVYSKPFRIVQDVTIAKAANGTRGRNAMVTVRGTLKYQACDESICYAPVSLPVAWTLALQHGPVALKKQ